ncbi:hypothetical protein ElyMa_002664400 [Elysia marginata]|uniref:Uncharacterized protein n=1 Tax=Elysia marginata TaxID=1093978 RepID=A0AAV4HA04_9GAST|nr:hypothetical protein ElyMa_002664400 [Elysia marginata]
MFNLILQIGTGQRDRVVSALDSRSECRGFDSQLRLVVIALGKQFTLTFHSPPTCEMGTQLLAILQLVMCARNILHMGFKWLSNVLVCWGISGAALWRHTYAE